MSTLDSWIDRDELAALVAELSPDSLPAAEPSNTVSDIAAPDLDASAAAAPLSDYPENAESFSSEIAPPAVPHFDEPEIASAVDFEATQAPESLAEVNPGTGYPEPFEAPDPSPAAEWNPEPVAEAAHFEVPSHHEVPELEEPLPATELVPDEVSVAEEAGPESMVSDEPEPEVPLPALDFDEPEAYAVSPFPAPESTNPDAPTTPLRRTAAVQAADALERARNRAQLGGLLKLFMPAPATPEEEIAPEAEVPTGMESESAQIGADEMPGIEPEPMALPDPEFSISEPAPEATGELPFYEPDGSVAADAFASSEFAPMASAMPESAVEPEVPLSLDEERMYSPVDSDSEFDLAIGETPVLSLRERLRGFVGRAELTTGSGDIAITDFQSYTLLPGTHSASAPHSALRLAHWFGSLAKELNASNDGVSQIALENGDWLCVVAADSAAGGVCASFRVNHPLSGEQARLLTDDLRSTLREPASLAAAS